MARGGDMSHITKEDIQRVKSGKVFVQVNDITHYDAEDVKINGYSLPELLHAAEEAAVYQYRERDVVLTAEMFGVALDKGGILTREAQLCDEVCDRLLPRGMKWPKFEDGEPVKFGDEVSLNNRCGKVNSVKFYSNGNRSIKAVDEDGNWGFVLIGKGEFIKRPEPKQDTLQDVIDDLAKNAVDYWGCALVSCEKCPSLIDGKTPGEYYGNVTCNYARCIDVKRRLEAIQERMGGDK